MNEHELLNKLDELVLALGCEYYRLSTSGQATYAELCSLVNTLVMEANHENETVSQQKNG